MQLLVHMETKLCYHTVHEVAFAILIFDSLQFALKKVPKHFFRHVTPDALHIILSMVRLFMGIVHVELIRTSL